MMSQDTELAGWVAELCTGLIGGGPVEDAIDRSVSAGAARADAEALARLLEQSPQVGLARNALIQLRCNNWMMNAYASLAELTQEPGTIDHVESIGQEEFLVDYYASNRPAVFPRIAAEWPAVKHWSKDYLAEACGTETIEVMMGRSTAPVPFQYAGDYLKQLMMFSEYLELVYSGASSNDYYLVARNRFFSSPKTAVLLDDLGPLPFVNTRSDVKDIKLWLGPGGTYTPLHYDATNNLLIQVIGTKVLRLYPPYYSQFMKQSIPWYAGVDPGFATLDADNARQLPEITVRLESGDGLFIPVGWWHAVSAEAVTLSLNFHDFRVPNEYPYL